MFKWLRVLGLIRAVVNIRTIYAVVSNLVFIVLFYLFCIMPMVEAVREWRATQQANKEQVEALRVEGDRAREEVETRTAGLEGRIEAGKQTSLWAEIDCTELSYDEPCQKIAAWILGGDGTLTAKKEEDEARNVTITLTHEDDALRAETTLRALYKGGVTGYAFEMTCRMEPATETAAEEYMRGLVDVIGSCEGKNFNRDTWAPDADYYEQLIETVGTYCAKCSGSAAHYHGWEYFDGMDIRIGQGWRRNRTEPLEIFEIEF